VKRRPLTEPTLGEHRRQSAEATILRFVAAVSLLRLFLRDLGDHWWFAAVLDGALFVYIGGGTLASWREQFRRYP
jgi:hypothetical protein